VGSGILGFRRAVIITALFAMLGAVLEGQYVISEVGKKIITVQVTPAAILTALTFAGLFVTLATIWRVPVSTAQATVGGITGVGLAMQLELSHGKLLKILGSWIICPAIALAMSYVLYIIITRIMASVKNQRLAYTLARYFMILSSCYVAYSLGANNVGNATGFIFNIEQFKGRTLFLAGVGGASIAIGALTFGRRVTMTVGKSITPLNVPGALAAQFSAAFGIHLFAKLGVPVSTSQAIVGAVMGVGLVKGTRAISKRTLARTAIGWVATPVCAGVATFLACKLFVG